MVRTQAALVARSQSPREREVQPALEAQQVRRVQSQSLVDKEEQQARAVHPVAAGTSSSHQVRMDHPEPLVASPALR